MSENREPIERVTRPREGARAAYNKVARWYDMFEGSFERPYIDKAIAKLNVQEGETVLEIGFGTGYELVQLARAVGTTGKVYGLDISDEMMRMAQARVDKEHLSERVELTRGDAVALPYDPATMDAVLMTFTLELFDTPDIPVVLGQCLRVLKPGGRFCAASLSKEGSRGIMTRLYEWAHRKLPNYADCRPIYARHAMEQAGFRVEDARRVSMWGLQTEIVLGSKPA